MTSEHFERDSVAWHRCYHVSEDRYAIAPEIQLRSNDLLMMKDGAAMGKLAYVETLPGPACLNSHLLLFRPKDGRFINRYLYYVLASPTFDTYMLRERRGSTFFGISQESIGAFPLVLPPLPEQTTIAAFLDRETAKIDALVAEQERLIELLKEKRQAVISHAVTKGLNPDAPMKDSGVEWLGEIPAHWEWASLSRIASRVVVGIAEAATHAYAEEGIPILRSTNIRAGKIVGEILFVDPAFANDRDTKRLRAGDLVSVRTGNAGVTAVVPPHLDGCQCFTMLITTLTADALSEYCCYWMNSASAQCYFSLEGWGTAQVNISVPILKALPIPIPPKAEQFAIVAALDVETTRVDSLIAEAQRAIELLQERRTALISAAVTGQIDVRDVERRAA
ncbi:MAG: restriction endonuclease subunit S [Blastocatellia bacterium]|nr:restriction endonuclease subunit S [Blastocatellia bacterium]